MKPGPKSRPAAGIRNTQLVPTLTAPTPEMAQRLHELDDPISAAIRDANTASEQWRLLKSVTEKMIDTLQKSLTNAVEGGKLVDLKLAARLLREVTTSAKALSSTHAAIVASFERLVSVKTRLDGGAGNLRDLSEVQLRQIVGAVVREFAIQPPDTNVTVQ